MGRIQSIETMGLLDGPGIRFVVFFQGCKLRCAYCHNPDTWDMQGGQEMSAKALVEKALKMKPYMDPSGGGVTCSGGDPLMQPEFLLEFLKLCKENGLQTALDTSGFGIGHYKEILEYTDLIILDLKHVDKEGYLSLTGGNIEEFYQFKKALDNKGNKLWIRHVVVPELTDGKKHLEKIKSLIKTFKNVEKVEFLPYHTLGVHKYKELGLKYRLENTPSLYESSKWSALFF